MSGIHIPFNGWSRDKLRRGIKTSTCRRKKYGEIGHMFTVEARMYRLVDIRRMTLQEVKDKWYKEEGCQTPEEFVDIWNAIHHKKGFVGTDRVFLHIFEQVY